MTPQFTGKERDSETGLDYFGARYYGSNMGRFLSPDRFYFQADMLTDPQRFNLYSYTRNNPLAFVDPTGEAIQLSNDEAERERQLKALCGMVGSQGCSYLYANKADDGNYYVGILSGGPSGKGADFGSLNSVTSDLGAIIGDKTIATLNIVGGNDYFSVGKSDVTNLNVAHADGATVSLNGKINIYVRDPDDRHGYTNIEFWKMSNWHEGERTLETVVGHELGHALDRMRNPNNQNMKRENQSGVDLETKFAG